ncbi:hypothetical protein ACJMK2_004819 [Sinanodonta woodiana]|uniref:Uncharacterized protein n=1 Tax=Sinanodonta woodiana TaxID=1069815 RepID=A0ABD3VNF7_SINWO
MDTTLSWLIQVSCLSLVMVLVSSHAEGCVEPGDEELRHQQEDEAKDMHWSFWMLPEMKDTFLQLNKINETYIQTKYRHIYGSKKCEWSGTYDFGASIFSHGYKSCPVYFELQHDSNRRPTNIIHARCRCERCQGTTKLSLDRCRPVSTYTRVLRKTGCENGVYRYEPVMEEIPIACTCLPTIAVKLASS